MGISYIEMNEQKIPIEDEELRGVVPKMQGAIDVVKRTLGYTMSKNYLPNPIVNNTQYGVGCVVNSNKSVTLNGKNTHTGRACWNLVGDALNNIYEEINGLEVGKPYTISGTPTGSSADTYGIYGVCQKADGTTFPINEIEDGANTFIHEKGNKYRIYIGVTGGVTVPNLTFYPMISEDGGDYEPYVEDVKTYIDDRYSHNTHNITFPFTASHSGILSLCIQLGSATEGKLGNLVTITSANGFTKHIYCSASVGSWGAATFPLALAKGDVVTLSQFGDSQSVYTERTYFTY
jgi:hypothetical protein